MKSFLKNLLVLASIMAFTLTSLYSQVTYNFEIYDYHRIPVQRLKITAKEASGKTIIEHTDAYGKASLKLDGGTWKISLPGMPNFKEFTIPVGSTGEGNYQIPYDLDAILAKNKVIRKRNLMDFDTIDVSNPSSLKIKKGETGLTVEILTPSGNPLPKIPISVVDVERGKIYQNKTNYKAQANFLVPIGANYAIDVDGYRNFGFSGMLDKEGFFTVRLKYRPTKINQTVNNDTIIQHLAKPINPTSTHTFLEITVEGDGNQTLPNENVYLRKIHSNIVYKNKTDNDGKVRFLLPHGEKYMLNFEFQKDVDVYNFTHIDGLHKVRSLMKYSPDPRLQYPENFIPSPEELFVEEFQSFIDKQLPDPIDERVGLFLKWGNDKVSAMAKEAVLEVGISVKNDKEARKYTPPLNLSFVIDKSGSMAGYGRIESLKESLIEFMDNLKRDDNVSLVTFDTEAFLEIPMQPKGDGKALKTMIYQVEAEGGTNIYNGLVMGYEEVLKYHDKEKNNRVILLSDGYGSTEPKIVVEKSKEYNQKGIDLSAIGVGENYNHALLSLLATAGGGLMQHSAESPDIVKSFQNELKSLISPIAMDAKLEIFYNDQIVFSHLFGFPVKSNQANKVEIEISNLYAGANKLALVQFDLDKPTQPIEEKPIITRITYFDVIEQKEVVVEEKAYLKWEPSTGKYKYMVERQQKKLYAIAIMNQSLKVMSEAFAAGDYMKAIHTVNRTKAQVEELFPNADEKDVAVLADKLAMYSIALNNYKKNRQRKK